MKKILLLVALFISVVCKSQITITEAIVAPTFTTLGYATWSNNYVTTDLFIVVFGTSFAGGTPATVSLSGTGLTWVEIANTLNASGERRMQAFRCVPTSGGSIITTVTYGGTGNQDGSWRTTYQVSGVAITSNGADAIAQTGTANGNSADPTITLSALRNSQSAVLFAFTNETNPAAGTAESGWTEIIEGGYATPNTGGYIMKRIQTTDNTPTVTHASSNWGAIAIELKSGRRIFNTR